MDVVKATAILNDARAAVDDGRGLAGTGFWGLVKEVKLNDQFGERFIDDVSTIDQQAFRNWALLTIPIGIGTALAVAATILGILVVGLSYGLDGFASGAALLVGTGIVLVATHGLGHLVAGAFVGIKFTSWFVGSIKQPQPGVKTDYASYLRTPARSRAWMHASGAIVSKVVPFLMIGAGLAADAPGWAVIALVAIGVGTIVTDILWSTEASDWKRFKREMAFARGD
jgi:hypothetical protein